MSETTIEMSRYNDLQAAYQECHENLDKAERLLHEARNTNRRLTLAQAEYELKLTSARSRDLEQAQQKLVTTEVMRNILYINLTHYRERCRDLNQKVSLVTERYAYEAARKLPLHMKIKEWWEER
jgi:uncharacterized protein YqgV (UPF0045/DUF77 family)